ncbi:HNH endonuclease [Pseudomonas chlororaphis]|uniref:HNH endonuclease n=1 Tax=Pseudomonas chlororaphis TaxID=587753 RepID=UPI0006897B94|nr:HNH endonuclease signature motif containing protein [Pseudomonas chlororaphis]
MSDDKLDPPLSDFSLSDEEKDAIAHALTLDDSWKLEQAAMEPVRDVLKKLRDRIKAFHMERQNNLCCYCRSNLYGGGLFTIDREHIIPKSHCKPLTYEISNLSVACKRCNMEIKKDKTTLFHNPATIKDTHENKDSYKIIHPNFEVYEEFITRVQIQLGADVLVKFNKNKEDAKADFTFDFFKLNELELNSFDNAQGLPESSATRAAIASVLLARATGEPVGPGTAMALISQAAASDNGDNGGGAIGTTSGAGSDMASGGDNSTPTLPTDSDLAKIFAAIQQQYARGAEKHPDSLGQGITLSLPPPSSTSDE